MQRVTLSGCPALRFEDDAGDTATLVAAVDGQHIEIRLHSPGLWLTREQAGRLAEVLARFAETGELTP